ncbi:hypothetical protein M3640_20860, partial [Bacillus velezensis]|nr:hypothetical protein [Bacillus velezensis]
MAPLAYGSSKDDVLYFRRPGRRHHTKACRRKAGKHTCFTFCGQSLKLASAQRRATPDDPPIQPTMPDTVCRPPRLILASSSRYRRALLERLGVPFDVVSP